jgi:hypothetical protein
MKYLLLFGKNGTSKLNSYIFLFKFKFEFLIVVQIRT